MHDVIDAIQSVLLAGSAWRLVPHDLPHEQTAYHYFRAWRQDGTWRRLHDQRRESMRTRRPEGCGHSPWLFVAAYAAFDRLQHIWADMAYRGQLLRAWVEEECGWILEIVQRSQR